MLERSEFPILLDFPNHDYMMMLFGGSLIADFRPLYGWSLWQQGPEGEKTKLAEYAIDMKENMPVHFYTDLADFVSVFQKERRHVIQIPDQKAWKIGSELWAFNGHQRNSASK